MMMTTEDSHFEIEIKYTDTFYQSLVKQSFSKKTLILWGSAYFASTNL